MLKFCVKILKIEKGLQCQLKPELPFRIVSEEISKSYYGIGRFLLPNSGFRYCQDSKNHYKDKVIE